MMAKRGETSEVVDQQDEAEDKETGEEAPQKLTLQVKVDSPSACQRHITVTVPREDIDRYYDRAFSDLVGTATIPGFRAGRAPRKLVESRFRKDVSDQVKGSLLMDSMTQVTEDEKLSAISEPDFDPTVIELPDDGPLTFEFNLEVRPDFDLPEWKGLSVERPMREFTDKDVQKRLENILTRYGRLVPKEGAAEVGDYITCNLAFKTPDGELSRSKEEVLRIRPVLSFRDGKIEGFDKVMKGVKAGQTREAPAILSQDAPNQALRGKTVTGVFEVLEVKQLELPKLTHEFLDEMGGFESEAELHSAVREDLQRQLEYAQHQAARRQITGALTASANWDLPPELLRRQSRRELERAVLELRRSGFAETEIRTHENELRQNSAAVTARALKEHFILERIAEDQSMEADADDYENEIKLIAQQTNETVRRVRARLEKGGLMDTLRNQIIERKVIDLVLSHAKFKDVPFKPEGVDTEAIDQAAGGGDEDESIPEAMHPDEPQAQPQSPAQRG